MKIAVIYPEQLPSKNARSISVTNTARFLSKYIGTTLFYEKSGSYNQIEEFYEIDLFKLNLIPISKKFLIRSNKIFNLNLTTYINKFDIFYVRHLKQAYFLIKKGKRVIYECHELFSLGNDDVKKIETFVLKNSYGIVFHNYSTKNEISGILKLSKNQSVIYNGHGFLLEYIKKDFSNIKDITYIGSLLNWKGVDFLIKCINNSKYSLKIFGNGRDREKSGEMANSNIEFLGFKNQSQIADILKKSKLCIIGNTKSRYSNFSTPIKLFEYMASSNIVLAPNFNPIKEIIEDGENGFLFEAENCNSLISVLNKISSLSSDRLEEIAKKAWETSQKFTWDERAKKIATFIKNSLS